MEKFYSLIILIACISYSQAWFETCNQNYTVTASTMALINSPAYPSRYAPGTSCKIYIVAPTGYTVNLQCSYTLDAPLSDCQSQRLYISRDGDRYLSYAEYFCGGPATLNRVSVGVEMSLGYTSNYGAAGMFTCQATAVKTDQNNCQCGWNKATRIVGGSYATPNEYVSMVGLIDYTMMQAPEGPVFCGAAIISENYVLTAAHCFDDTSRLISNIYALVGDHDYKSATDTPYPTIYQVQQIIKHESYNINNNDENINDIALVKTVDAIKWKLTIGPACLPFVYSGAANSYFDGYPLVVLGWGATVDSGPTSSILKKTSLPVISNSVCSQYYTDITAKKICTYAQGTDACQRDSGGSLYWNGVAGRKYPIGIVSYGTNCAGSYPGVNTRVTAYLSWIQTKAPTAFFCNK